MKHRKTIHAPILRRKRDVYLKSSISSDENVDESWWQQEQHRSISVPECEIKTPRQQSEGNYPDDKKANHSSQKQALVSIF